MGRHTAGESFLRGYLTHADAAEFWVQVADPGHAPRFVEKARELGRQEPVEAVDAGARANSSPGFPASASLSR